MNDQLIQTRVEKQVLKVVEKLARESGSSVATWLRQMLIREARVADEVKMKIAREVALAAIRPASLAAEFQVPKDQIVDAIARALLPFISESFVQAVK